MKNLLCLILLITQTYGFSQSILGKWKTIHQTSKKPVSIVEFFEKDGRIFGRIDKILEKEHQDDLCKKCKGNEKNAPILGLTIIKNMEKVDGYYTNGTIFHPVLGKTFRCRIKFLPNNPNVIQVRGYFLFFFGTQYWERIL